MLDCIIFNAPVQHHISFWKLRRIGEGIGHVTHKKKHVVQRIEAMISKHVTKELMRGFWKIDRCLDPEDSLTNMSGANTPLMSRNVSRNVSRGPSGVNVSRGTSQSKRLPPKTPSKAGSPTRRPTNDAMNRSAINVRGNY